MYGLEHGEILAYFYDKTGIFFDEKKDIVASKIDSFYASRGYVDIRDFFAALKRDAVLWQDFVNLLTVNETYFFRETKQMEMLVEMARGRQRFNIICAPSSSGEEPYTILIMLAEAGLLSKVGKFVGIDINSYVIDVAKAGIYTKKSLHRTPDEIAGRYFVRLDDQRYEIAPQIKSLVEFNVFNIFDPAIDRLGTFDFVFSRNMIIYFDKDSKLAAEKALYSLLKPEGVLFLGHADIIQNSFGLKKFVQNGIVYYQKS